MTNQDLKERVALLEKILELERAIAAEQQRRSIPYPTSPSIPPYIPWYGPVWT